MNMPGFTAEVSTYRSRGRYVGRAGSDASASGAAVELAYRPGPATERNCQSCRDGCDSSAEICAADAQTILLGCIFPPDCAIAAAAYGEALTSCYTSNLICKGTCEFTDCCPKICGFPNPLDPGSGCCDHGEHCVDENDPNARDGCCPADQSTCGGKCCAPGDTCCGDACCPAGFTCQQGVCCGPYDHVCGGQCCGAFNKCCNGQCCQLGQDCDPATGACASKPPDFPVKRCRLGWEFSPACGCCPPGQMCCGNPPQCQPGYQCIH
jgi:hypothetical protein